MSSANRNSLKIGLLDHMGYGNLGDVASQDVAIANIRKRLPEAQLIGFSFVPADTTARHGIPCYPIRWWYPNSANTEALAAGPSGAKQGLKFILKRIPFLSEFAKSILECLRDARFWVISFKVVSELDILVISGGGQLSDLWRGPWSHPYAIFRFCLLAKLAGKKLYFLNVGAGPLDHWLSKWFAKQAVKMADYRSFRDEDSRELVRRLGVKAETHVNPDLAYGLAVEQVENSVPCGASMPIVGINPIGFCDPRNWARKDEAVYRDYLKKIVDFSAWLLEQGYQLRIFTTEASLDKLVIADMRAALQSRVSAELFGRVGVSNSNDVKNVLREMAEFDFVVTSKFHGIIFSQVLGKPVISLSYHKKMDFAMQAAGQERFNANIERFDAGWLMEAFRCMVEGRAEISRKSAAVVSCYAARLAKQFDRLLLQETS
jgi:polysaccharide pyruvyl transferase WcaK-like protein